MENNYKFSKASHYLDQDSVKQNQFMVPNKSFTHKSFTNKSFNSKASPTKASSMEDNYKFSKASHYLDQDSVKQNQFMVPNKSFNSKASPTKASPTIASPTKASPIKASPTKCEAKSIHGTQKKLQLQSFTYNASTPKLHLQKLHPQ
ncbi:hypothetical protein ACFX2I_019288 [Malus domestica]